MKFQLFQKFLYFFKDFAFSKSYRETRHFWRNRSFSLSTTDLDFLVQKNHFLTPHRPDGRSVKCHHQTHRQNFKTSLLPDSQFQISAKNSSTELQIVPVVGLGNEMGVINDKEWTRPVVPFIRDFTTKNRYFKTVCRKLFRSRHKQCLARFENEKEKIK